MIWRCIYILESVMDNMLMALVQEYDHVAVVFYRKGDPTSQVVDLDVKEGGGDKFPFAPLPRALPL